MNLEEHQEQHQAGPPALTVDYVRSVGPLIDNLQAPDRPHSVTEAICANESQIRNALKRGFTCTTLAPRLVSLGINITARALARTLKNIEQPKSSKTSRAKKA